MNTAGSTKKIKKNNREETEVKEVNQLSRSPTGPRETAGPRKPARLPAAVAGDGEGSQGLRVERGAREERLLGRWFVPVCAPGSVCTQGPGP